MKKMMMCLQNLLLLFFVSFAIVSCNDEETDNTVKNIGNGEMEAVFKITVPTNNFATGAGLRSIGLSQENTIERIDVLAFRRDPSDNHKIVFDYYAEGYSITDNSFTARMKMRDYEQSFVVVANVAPGLIKEKFDSTWVGTEKAVILGYLKYSFPEDSHWTKNNYNKIPMSGISNWVTVGLNGKQIAGTIPLMRIVAKINVQIANEKIDSLGEVFKLDCVYLYKGNTRGYIVPDTDKVVDGRAIRPTVPLDANPAYAVSFCNDGEEPSRRDIAIRGAIYTFESENSLHFDNPQEAECLIVGGRYGRGNMTDTTYFRLDFLTDDEQGFLNILRNYEYDFNIVNVTSTGYLTPDVAYTSREKKMIVDVVPWSVQAPGDVIFIGQSYLNVSRSEFSFSRMAYTEDLENNEIYVKTNHILGWNIDSIVDLETRNPITWLRMSGMSAMPPQSEATNKILLYLDANTTGKVRAAQFSVNAGHLRYPVTVYQTLAEGIELNLFRGNYNPVEPDDTIHEWESIIFPAFDVSGQSVYSRNFHIRWRPKDQVVIRYMTPVPGMPILLLDDPSPFTQLEQTDTGDRNFAYVDFTKNHKLALKDQVTEENPFPEQQSYAIYTATNGVESRQKIFLYRLIYFNCRLANVRDSYPLNGNLQTVNVRSNNAWSVRRIIDDYNILRDREVLNGRTGGERAVVRNDVFQFSLVNDPSKNGREAKIIFGVLNGFPNNDYRTDTLTIHAVY